MATATARRTRRAQGEAQEQPQGQVTETGEAAAEPKPAIEVEAVPVTYFRPKVTLADGTVIVCQHKYLHEHQKAAEACGRRMLAAGQWVK